MVPSDFSSPLALRLTQAARLLGVSQRTLWQWVKTGIVPHVRIGNGKRRVILFPVAELRSWLAQRAAKPEGGGQ